MGSEPETVGASFGRPTLTTGSPAGTFFAGAVRTQVVSDAARGRGCGALEVPERAAAVDGTVPPPVLTPTRTGRSESGVGAGVAERHRDRGAAVAAKKPGVEGPDVGSSARTSTGARLARIRSARTLRRALVSCVVEQPGKQAVERQPGIRAVCR